ncbi:MAG: desulfoferrodoxin [Patescibacteria group bacterium]|jgi:superoxide reductase
MTILNQVYKCGVCGNIVEMTHAGAGELVCCGQPMVLQAENTVDAALEKHVPVRESVGDKVIVKVGSVEHPMEEAHYIEWIEVLTTNRVYRKYLTPELDRQAKAEFTVDGEVIKVRAYCNLHGLWQS